MEASEGARFGYCIRYQTEIIEPHILSAWQCNSCCCEISDSFRAWQRANGLDAIADLAAPTCKIDIAGAKLTADVDRSHANGLQHNRIQVNSDLALDTSNAVNAQSSGCPGACE